MKVVLVEGEMRDRGCWLWVSICQSKCPSINYSSCSTKAFLNWSILGAPLNDLDIRI